MKCCIGIVVEYMSSKKNVNFISRQTNQIRVAIVGMGKMGNIHLQSLWQLAGGLHEDYYKGAIQNHLGKIVICGICDVNPAKLGQHAEIAGFDSIERLIAQTRPHMAIITTPTTTHFELAKAALEKSVHVLVEKPIVTTKKQIDHLTSIAEENGCRLLSGHVERYNPVSIKIASLFEEKSLAIDSYSFERTQEHDQRISDDIIIDKIIHDIDLSQYFFGSIADVTVEQTQKVDGKIYQVRLQITHDNKKTGGIFASWLVDAEQKNRKVEIFCKNHKIVGDFMTKRLWLDAEEMECEVRGMIKPENNQIKDELVDFIMHCLAPDPEQKPVMPLLSLDEIKQSVVLLEKITIAVNADDSESSG